MKKKNTPLFGRSFLSGEDTSDTVNIQTSTGKLVPAPLFFFLVLVSLSLPNLVFSGTFWFQTLHIMKWFVAMLPIGILAAILGVRLLRSGSGVIDFKVDIFGWIWLFFVLYVTAQPLWADISSVATFLREWFFFATLWAAYVLFYNYFRSGYLCPVLWLANINAALNVIFAELQFARINHFFPFVLPTPGHYIGNTGQQNMLGFWLAICALNCVYLHFSSTRNSGSSRDKALRFLNLALLFVISWGIWGSTSRSGILSLFTGLLFMWIITLRLFDRNRRKRLGTATVVLMVALVSSVVLNHVRMESMWWKTLDVLKNPKTIGSRDSIWMTSFYVFRDHPIRGVGLGQYKWNYLKGQREMLKDHPGMDWKYTYWAHNEYLQWFCEAGLIPGIILLGLAFWWIWSFVRGLILKKELSLDSVWAISMLGLIWFNALWTRPFHRIEDALWMSLAFALANRKILPLEAAWTKVRRSYLYRALGALILLCSLAGFVYFFQGMQGDILLRKAVQTRNPFTQRKYLEKAYEHLMVRDIAERQLAYHYLSLGKATKNAEHTVEGVNRLYRHFQKEPHSRELKILLDWGVRLQNRNLTEEIASFLKPGSFNIRWKQN
jgi:O-antigen ligase